MRNTKWQDNKGRKIESINGVITHTSTSLLLKFYVYRHKWVCHVIYLVCAPVCMHEDFRNTSHVFFYHYSSYSLRQDHTIIMELDCCLTPQILEICTQPQLTFHVRAGVLTSCLMLLSQVLLLY